MGFFDKLKKKKTNSKENSNNEFVSDSESYKKIVSLIDKQGNALDDLSSCIDNPREYYMINKETYEDRGIFEDEDLDTIIWLGIVDYFLEKEVVFELDFKEELSEFVYAIEDLIEDRSLEFAEEWFDEESDISEWVKIINYKWSGSGYVLACIDIDSDSYCLFVINNDDYKIIADEANKIGHRIIVLD